MIICLDWIKLREARILGNFVGNLANLPRQESFPGLPLVLLPEETALLLEKRMGVLREVTEVLRSIGDDLKLKHEDFEKKIRSEQVK